MGISWGAVLDAELGLNAASLALPEHPTPLAALAAHTQPTAPCC